VSTYSVRFRLRAADVTPELEALIKAHGPYSEGAGFTRDGEVADVDDAHTGLEDELVRRGVPLDRVLETDGCELVREERRFRPAAGGQRGCRRRGEPGGRRGVRAHVRPAEPPGLLPRAIGPARRAGCPGPRWSPCSPWTGKRAVNKEG